MAWARGTHHGGSWFVFVAVSSAFFCRWQARDAVRRGLNGAGKTIGKNAILQAEGYDSL
jgi:hypothetical protein